MKTNDYVNQDNNGQQPPKTLGIYIHIPFCVRKCFYCDFLSFEKCNNKFGSYVNSLCNQIKIESKHIDKEEYIVDSVFIGGGTPSVLGYKPIGEILDTIRSSFDISKDCEITVECNPGTVDEDFFIGLHNFGVNRISLGLQSANDDELKLIGRIHRFDDFLKAYEGVRKSGIDNVNVDIIHSLPYQTKEKYANTLEKVAELKPNHISAYSLILEEGTPIMDMNYEYPSEDDDMDLYEYTEEFLSKHGYSRYEISNFALMDDRLDNRSRHNVKYWTLAEYLGLGLGSSSMMYKDGKRVRWHMTDDLDAYISGLYTKLDEEILEGREDMAEFMFLGLRMTAGVSKSDFYNRYAQTIEDVYGDIINKHIEEGLLKTQGDRIMLTNKGLELSNYVMKDFL